MTEQEYYDLIQPYSDARDIILNRLNVLKHNMYHEAYGKQIHNIQDRIKKKASIEGKLLRLGRSCTVEDAKDFLQDIAGIRVICYYVKDVYELAKALKRQTDIIPVRERDYIKEPKPNGYRSCHLIIGVPVYYLDGMEYYPVEVQIRTISMDFWASMEHRILYKKMSGERERIAEELKIYADVLVDIESKFEHYSDKKGEWHTKG